MHRCEYGQIDAALGNWLSGFSWDTWVTGTTYPGTPETTTERHLRRFLRWLTQRAQRRIAWAYVVQRSPGGIWHIHALVWTQAALSPKQVAETWRFGRPQAEAYDPRRGASHYLARDTGSGRWWWDVSSHMPPATEPTPHGHYLMKGPLPHG